MLRKFNGNIYFNINSRDFMYTCVYMQRNFTQNDFVILGLKKYTLTSHEQKI